MCIQTTEDGTDLIGLHLCDYIKQIVLSRLIGHRRAGLYVAGRDFFRVANLINPKFFDGLAQITWRHFAGIFANQIHRIMAHRFQPCIAQGRLNFIARRRIIVDTDRVGRFVAFKQLAQRGTRIQLPRGDNDLRVAFNPVDQCGRNGFGNSIGCVFDKRDAVAREKPLRLDGITKQRRVFAQLCPRHTGQAHFFFAVGPHERLDNVLAFQRDPHGIAAIDQNASTRLIGFSEISCCVARGQFHGADATIMSVTIKSASAIARRSRASFCASRVATVVPKAE